MTVPVTQNGTKTSQILVLFDKKLLFIDLLLPKFSRLKLVLSIFVSYLVDIQVTTSSMNHKWRCYTVSKVVIRGRVGVNFYFRVNYRVNNGSQYVTDISFTTNMYVP